MLRIGILADTHGLLRPEAVCWLRGSNHLIHAGDIGHPGILQELARVAPLTAVRGNNDTGSWAHTLPETQTIRLAGMLIHVLHDLAELEFDPAAAGVRVVISGHSHQPLIRERDGILYVNPGSAGPRRFRLPVAAAELRIHGVSVTPLLKELPIVRAPPDQPGSRPFRRP